MNIKPLLLAAIGCKAVLSLVLCLRRLGGIITKSQLVIDDVVSEAQAALDYNPLLEEVE